MFIAYVWSPPVYAPDLRMIELLSVNECEINQQKLLYKNWM